MEYRKPKERACKGVAMLEMALVAPLFVILLINVVDLARLISTYTLLTGIAKEGVRAASNVPYLEPGWWKVVIDPSVKEPFFQGGTDYPGPPALWTSLNVTTSLASKSPFGQVRLLNRVRSGIFDYLSQGVFIDRTRSEIRSYFSSLSVEPPMSHIEIVAYYRSLFHLFNDLELRIISKGPYG